MSTGTETEVDQVAKWRKGELEKAGYPDNLAKELATRFDIDLHSAVDMVGKRGCTPETAAQILL